MNNYNVELYVRPQVDRDLERVEFDVFQFPGGELQLRDLTLPTNADEVVLYMRGSDPYSIVTVNLIIEVLDSLEWLNFFTLAVPYFPAARSDRGQYAALPAYLKMLIDTLPGEGNTIAVLDIHNERAMRKLYSSSYVKYVSAEEAVFHTDALMETEYIGVIAPDEGAVPRASEVADTLKVPLYTATKDRDFETGKLTKFEAPEGLTTQGNYLVVDDICDGGGTFAGLAEVIRLKYGKVKLDLWVTHAIFSGNWENNLMDEYHHVYTTNSHPNVDNINHPRVHVTDIRPFMIGE